MGCNCRATNPLVVAFAVLILAATALQALLVFIVNTPPNALKAAFDPILRVYKGPEIAQGWALFAPRVDIGNTHVIIRARLRSGHLTEWYDATEFFAIKMHENRFTPTRALAEVLLHGADSVIVHDQRRPHRDAVVRVAAMVLQTYVPTSEIDKIQVELDRWSIPAPRSGGDSKIKLVKQLPWIPMPDVATL